MCKVWQVMHNRKLNSMWSHFWLETIGTKPWHYNNKCIDDAAKELMIGKMPITFYRWRVINMDYRLIYARENHPSFDVKIKRRKTFLEKQKYLFILSKYDQREKYAFEGLRNYTRYNLIRIFSCIFKNKYLFSSYKVLGYCNSNNG